MKLWTNEPIIDVRQECQRQHCFGTKKCFEEGGASADVAVGCYVDGASTTLILGVKQTTLIMKVLKASNHTCSDCITNISPPVK
jgi:hypothetical protein